jgi:uncharacterized protein (UPF0335 family)
VIVFKKSVDGREHHGYSHIECDVDGCGAVSPTFDELGKQNLMERGCIENLIEERQTINDDIKDVKAEAKGQGYDATTLMAVIKVRKMTAAKYQEQRSLLDTYLAAFGITDEE